jgi:hypothetical protein
MQKALQKKARQENIITGNLDIVAQDVVLEERVALQTLQ